MPETAQHFDAETLAAWDAEIEAAHDATSRARLIHASGRLIEDHLEQPKEALQRYQQAISEDPAYLPALRDARRLYRVTGQYLMVAEMLAREAPLCLDRAERAELLWERGGALARAGANTGDVRAAYEEALIADPANLPGFQALAAILAEVEDWAALSGTCRRAADAARDPAVKAGILCELARHTELREGDPDAAADTYSAAVDADPTHMLALVELERLARRLDRPGLLARTLEQLAALTGSGADAARDLEETARIRFHALDDEPGAVQALRAALRADPAYAPTFDRAEDLLADHERWEDLAALLGRRAEATLEPEGRAAMLCRQAEVHADQLGRTAAAVATYREALAYCPTYLPALRALGALLSSTADWEGLVELFLAEAEAVEDPVLQGARWVRAAEILEHRLHDPPRAIEVLRSAVASAPGRLAAVRNLVRLLGRLGGWSEAADVLAEEVVRNVPDDLKTEFLARLAEIRELHLNDPGGAVEALGQLVALRPEDTDARDDLLRLHRRMGNWEHVVRLREEEAERLTDSRAIASALQEVGEILEVQLRDNERAEAAYRRVLQVHPGYVPALRALGRIYRGSDRYDDVLEIYRREAEVAADDDHRAAGLLRVAEVLREHLERVDEAEQVYREALDLRPGDQAALAGLEEILRDSGDDDALIEVLEARVAAAGDERDRTRLLCALAEVLEEAQAPEDDRLEAWGRAVAEDPDSAEALRALARLHGQAGRWGEQASILDRLLGSTADPLRQLLQALRLASVRRDRLGDRDGAAAYQVALAADPGHVSTLQGLDSLLRDGRGRHEADRLAVLEGLASVIDDASTVASIRTAAARLREAAGERAEARANHRATLRVRPADPLALEAMESELRSTADWQGLADLYGAARAATDDGEVRADHAVRIASLLSRAGDERGARSTLEGAAAESPDDPVVVAALAEARRRTGDRAGALEARETLARLRSVSTRCASELVACGDAWSEDGDEVRSLALYEEAFLLEPSVGAALDRISDLLRRRGSSEHLVGVVANGLEIARGAAARAELGRRLARLHRGAGDLVRASQALSVVLEAQPEDLGALREQARLLEDLVELEDAAATWERLARLCSAEDDVREALLAAGRLRSVLPGQTKAAEEALLRVLDRWPADLEALGCLKEVREASGDADGAVWAGERIARGVEGADEQLDALLEVARLHGMRRDTAAARNALARARKSSPRAPEPVARLGELLESAGDLKALEVLYKDYVDTLPSGEAARGVPFRLELGRLAWEQRSDAEAALEQYARIVELDPSHEGAREALAFLFAQTRDGLERALDQHRILLANEPLRVESYLALLRVFERMRDDDRAFLAGGVLQYLGALSEEDSVGMEEFRSRLPVAPRGTVGPEELARHLRDPEDGEELRVFLRSLRSLAARLTHKRLKALGATRSRRVASAQSDPVAGLIDRCAEWLGVEELNLYRVPDGRWPITVVPGAPPAIVVHEACMEPLDLTARRFELVRATALCDSNIALVEEHGPEWLVGLMLAAAPDCEAADGVELIGEGVLEAVAASVRDAGPRRLRLAAGRAAAQILKSVDLGRLLRQAVALPRTVDRAGLLACGDAATALTAIGGEPAGEDLETRVEALRDQTDVSAALAFLLSDEHLSLRQRLGMRLD